MLALEHLPLVFCSIISFRWLSQWMWLRIFENISWEQYCWMHFLHSSAIQIFPKKRNKTTWAGSTTMIGTWLWSKCWDRSKNRSRESCQSQWSMGMLRLDNQVRNIHWSVDIEVKTLRYGAIQRNYLLFYDIKNKRRVLALGPLVFRILNKAL